MHVLSVPPSVPMSHTAVVAKRLDRSRQGVGVTLLPTSCHPVRCQIERRITSLKIGNATEGLGLGLIQQVLIASRSNSEVYFRLQDRSHDASFYAFSECGVRYIVQFLYHFPVSCDSIGSARYAASSTRFTGLDHRLGVPSAFSLLSNLVPGPVKL